MNGKQLFVTVVLSSLLTTAVLSGFFAWGGFAAAQHSATETGEGPAATAQITVAEGEISPILLPAAADNMTGEGVAGSMEQIAANVTTASLANGVQMSHWSILGSHLLPRSSGIQYVYTANGCIYITNSGGEVRMQFPVTLPDRAVIKSMDVFYDDTSASNLTVWLTRYVPGQSNQDVVSVASSGNAGWGTNSSPEVTHIVDNGSWAYSLNYSWDIVTNNSLQICGIRINYIDPFYSSFLPLTITE